MIFTEGLVQMAEIDLWEGVLSIPWIRVNILLFSFFVLSGCGAFFGFSGFVIADQERLQRGQERSEVLVVKLRSPQSGETISCGDDWVTALLCPFCNEAEICKEFFVGRGYKPVATLTSHVGWIVDVNFANAKDLVTIFHELGMAEAQAIVDGQPYHRKSELVQRGILSPLAYERMQKKFIVRERAGNSDAKGLPPISFRQHEIEW